MKIYTKKGDGGQTSLIGGDRVPKDDPRVEAYGSVDELGANIAHLYDNIPVDARLEIFRADLIWIIPRLMNAAAVLASGPGLGREKKASMPSVSDGDIEALERMIDRTGEGLPVPHMFTLPVGHPLVSQCHICRTVCRRAERACVAAGAESRVLAYLNRLSDYLYVLGRKMTAEMGVEERYWKS